MRSGTELSQFLRLFLPTFAALPRAAEHRTSWKGIVANSDMGLNKVDRK